MAERLVTVKWFHWLVEADLTAAALRSYGIESFLADQYFILWFPLHAMALGGIKLKVREGDALDAGEILRWLERDEQVRCPNCAGSNVAMDKSWGRRVLLTVLFLTLIAPLVFLVCFGCVLVGVRLSRIGVRWRCEDCGWGWQLRGS